MSGSESVPGFLPVVDPFMIMKETDPSVIDAQIAAGVEAQGERGAFGFLNNFEANLPGGMYRSWAEPQMDSTPKDPTESLEAEYFSERIKHSTWRQFFEDIDQATVQSGVDPVELARLIELSKVKDYHGEAQRELATFALPIYRQLRIMGYAHYDLVH